MASDRNCCPLSATLCLALLAVMTNVGTVWNEVVWDDRAAVAYNTDLHRSTSVSNLWHNDYWGQPMTAVDSHKSWRPLATLTFRWNYLVHRLEPVGYHVINIFLHALTTCLVMIVGAHVLRDRRSAMIASLMFVAHPIHTEPVASIVGRADLLCGVFTLAAVYFHLISSVVSTCDATVLHQMNRFTAWAIAHALALAACLSKEVGIACFPLFTAFDMIILLCDIQPWKGPMVKPRTSPPLRRITCLRCAISTACALIVLLIHAARHGKQLLYSWTVLENSVASNLRGDVRAQLLSYAYIHTQYFSKLLLPLRLSYDYGHPCIDHVTSVLDVRNLQSFTLYLLLLVVTIVGLLYRLKSVLYTILLIALPFVPASHVFLPIGTILGERLLYLPSVGFCLLFALLYRTVEVPAKTMKVSEHKPTCNSHFLVKVRRSTGHRRRYIEMSSKSKWRRIVQRTAPCAFLIWRTQLATAGALFICAVLRTISRNSEWRSEHLLFESSIDVCPLSLKVTNNLALVLMAIGKDSSRTRDLVRAARLLDEAIDVHPNFSSAMFNRALLRRLEERHMAAIYEFNRALSIETDHLLYAYVGLELWLLVRNGSCMNCGHRNLGHMVRTVILSQAGQHLLKGQSSLPLASCALASVAFDLGDYTRAGTLAERALIQLSAADNMRAETGMARGSMYNILGLAWRARGDDAAALGAFMAGLKLNPACFELLANAASLYADNGNDTQAVSHFELALRMEPMSAELISNYGYFYEQHDQFQSAFALYKQAQQTFWPARHPQIETNLLNLEKKLAINGTGANRRITTQFKLL